MESIKFKQFKNPKSNYLGIGFILFGLVASFEKPLIGLFVLLVGIVFLGLNFEIEITENFKNKLNINLFNLKLHAINKELITPEYISLFGQSFSHSNDFGAVSSIGSNTEFDFYVIRFFDDNNRNDIIFKSKNKTEVLEKGTQLASLLNVELVNKIEA